MRELNSLIKEMKPARVLIAALTYYLGAGVARYLGTPILWMPLLLGFIGIVSFHSVLAGFANYFRAKRVSPPQYSEKNKEDRRLMLLSFYAGLGLSGIAFLSLLVAGYLNIISGLLMFIATAVFMIYSLPPLGLASRGYGDILEAFLLAMIYPLLGYTLQSNDLHFSISLVAFPLFFQAFAYLLAVAFPEYAKQNTINNKSILHRISWQNAVTVHHIFLISSYLITGLLPAAGFSWKIIWPVMLGLPLALLQMALLQNIANGGRALWKAYNLLPPISCGLFSYLLAFSFWSH